jgi:hypothetical protein
MAKRTQSKKTPSTKTKKGTRKKGKIAKKVMPELPAHELMFQIASQPLHAIAADIKVRMPLYACLDNGPGAKCALMRYNPKTRQYDLEEGDIDCSLCTHFVQPTG